MKNRIAKTISVEKVSANAYNQKPEWNKKPEKVDFSKTEDTTETHQIYRITLPIETLPPPYEYKISWKF